MEQNFDFTGSCMDAWHVISDSRTLNGDMLRVPSFGTSLCIVMYNLLVLANFHIFMNFYYYKIC